MAECAKHGSYSVFCKYCDADTVRISELEAQVAALTERLSVPPENNSESEDHPTDALVERLRQWMGAYPFDLWPEIDPGEWKVIDKVLADAGAPSLSRISASNMRHVVTKLGEYLPPASPDPVANALQAMAPTRDDITRIIYAYEGAIREAEDDPDNGKEALDTARADLLALLQNAKRWADATPESQ